MHFFPLLRLPLRTLRWYAATLVLTCLALRCLPGEASAQTAGNDAPAPAATPADLPATMKDDLVTGEKGKRRLAPHDTFFLMKYVSAKTDKGVEGFPPGTEVRLVEVHRPTETMVVTNGRAEVEVSPGDLTNDLDVAAMVRQHDDNTQARIAQYQREQQVAYKKYQEDVARYTQQDIDRREQQKQQQVENALAAKQVENQEIAASMSASPNNDYYGNNGYGYGSPYSYFVGGSAVGAQNAAPAAGNRNAAPAAPATRVNPATVGTAGPAHPGPR